MATSPPPPPVSLLPYTQPHPQQQQPQPQPHAAHPAFLAHAATAAAGPRDYEQRAGGVWQEAAEERENHISARDVDADMAVALSPPAEEYGLPAGPGLGLHKRRRSESACGSLEVD